MPTNSLPPAEVKTSGRGGFSAAHGAPVILGSGVYLHDNNVVSTGDGTDYVTDEDDVVVKGDTTTSALTVTVTDPADGRPKLLVVLDEGGNAASRAITVEGSGSNINGSATRTISSNYGSMRLLFDGTQWYKW